MKVLCYFVKLESYTDPATGNIINGPLVKVFLLCKEKTKYGQDEYFWVNLEDHTVHRGRYPTEEIAIINLKHDFQDGLILFDAKEIRVLTEYV